MRRSGNVYSDAVGEKPRRATWYSQRNPRRRNNRKYGTGHFARQQITLCTRIAQFKLLLEKNIDESQLLQHDVAASVVGPREDSEALPGYSITDGRVNTMLSRT